MYNINNIILILLYCICDVGYILSIEEPGLGGALADFKRGFFACLRNLVGSS